MKKNLLIILLILILAIFFRIYRLEEIPPSPSLDEVSIGWNAYSILKTGKDEYGYHLPLLLRAYDDWRPAGYVYLVIPFIKVIGLKILAVRLPAVILGLITILVVYFLVGGLFDNKIALITTFFLSISPWHIYISRLGHEVNLGLSLFIFGIFFFIKYQKTNWGLILSNIFLVLSFYAYQSNKIFIPPLVIALIFIYQREIKQNFKKFILASGVALLFLIPILITFFTQEGIMRFKGTNLLANIPEVYEISASRIARDYEKKDYLGIVFDNRRIAAGQALLKNYFSHFNPTWIFFNSGKEPHKVPNFGVLPLWFIPLLLFGFYQLTFGKFSSQTKKILLFWLFLAPLGGSLTTGAPHAMRTFNILPVPQIIASLGLVFLWGKIQPKWKKLLKFIGGIFLLIHLLNLYHQYFINFPYEQSDSFQYSLREAIIYAIKNQDKYQKIIITNQEGGYQSYMFYLFFSQYPPERYLKEGGTSSGGYLQTHKIGKFEFRPIHREKEERNTEIFYIGNINDFPSNVSPKVRFKLLNSEENLWGV